MYSHSVVCSVYWCLWDTVAVDRKRNDQSADSDRGHVCFTGDRDSLWDCQEHRRISVYAVSADAGGVSRKGGKEYEV